MKDWDVITPDKATFVAILQHKVKGVLCVVLDRSFERQTAEVTARLLDDASVHTEMKLVEEGFRWAQAQRVVNYVLPVSETELTKYNAFNYYTLLKSSDTWTSFLKKGGDTGAHLLSKRSVEFQRDYIRCLPDFKTNLQAEFP